MHDDPESAAPALTNQAQLERIGEPWSVGRTAAVAVTLFFALVLGSWTANGEFENIILLAVWFAAVMIIVFVRDHWWSPALVITALSFKSWALGFSLSGLEVGVIILAITFPIKMAMKTLRKAEPEYDPGIFYWLLVTYVCIHAVIILFYNHMEGVQLKNIIKAYYTVITPLVFFGVLMRYCHTRTVKPACYVIFFALCITVFFSIVTTVLGLDIQPFSDLSIDIDWLSLKGAAGLLRVYPVTLIAGAIAFWPVVRKGLPRVILGFVIFFSSYGVLMSGGRMALITSVAIAIFFSIIRGRIWIAVAAVICLFLVSGAITLQPTILYSLPEMAQRGLAPLNFSEQKTEVQDLESSDEWHRDLRSDSLYYWWADTTSIFLGHGFKSWDDSVTDTDAWDAEEVERRKQLAVEMGLTENMFSAITNIFGAAGLVLYGGFMIQLTLRLWKGAHLSPDRSAAKALCQFSLVTVSTAIVFSPFLGRIPDINLVFWSLGLLAARPYLVAGEKAPLAEEERELPAYARPAMQGFQRPLGAAGPFQPRRI